MRWILPVLGALAVLALVVVLTQDGGEASNRGAASVGGATEPAESTDADAAAELQAATTLDATRAADVAPPATDDTRRVAAPGTPRARGAALRFVDADGATIAGADWVVFRAAAVVAEGRSDPDGRGELPPDTAAEDAAAPLEVAAVAPGFAPVRSTLDALEREPGADDSAGYLVRLGVGDAIAGIVRVDGARPVQPVRLTLRGDAPLVDGAGLPPDARVSALRGTSEVRRLSLDIGGDGAFAFRGLPTGWEGSLQWGSDYRLQTFTPADRARGTGRTNVDLTAPVADAVLELATAPALIGRAIDPVGGGGASGAFVRCSWTRPGGGSSSSGRGAEADGAFRFSFPEGLPTRVELEVAADRAFEGARYTFDIPPGQLLWDVGPVVAPLAETLEVRVVDLSGAPIAGAWIEPAGEGGGLHGFNARRQRLNDGTGAVGIQADVHALRASAMGFAAAEVPLPPPDRRGDPLVIELAPGPVLVVTLPEGARDLSVVITGDEPPFEGSEGPTWMPEIGQKGVGRSMYEDRIELRNAADGRYEIAPLRAGVGFRVAARDGLGMTHAAHDIAPLAPGEHRELALEFELGRRDVAGVVLGPEGAPVAGATVHLGVAFDASALASWQGLAALRTRTDADGAFAFDGVTLARASLVAAKAGYAPRLLEDVELGAAPLTVVLEVGREVRIEVVDEDGAAVPGATISGVGGAHGYMAGAAEDGDVLRIANAPTGAFEAVVTVCGRADAVAVPADADTVRHAVGRVIACTVALPGLRALRPDVRVTVYLERRGGPVGLLYGVLAADAEEVVIPALFPGVYEISAQAFEPHPSPAAEPETLSIDADGARIQLTLRAP